MGSPGAPSPAQTRPGRLLRRRRNRVRRAGRVPRRGGAAPQQRAGPLTDRERATFANHPLRLAGLLVPRAFDDAPEVLEDPQSVASPYTEFFTEGSAAFADSVVLGAPALLLALAGAFARRKGALLF